jgi:hypothetical protein
MLKAIQYISYKRFGSGSELDPNSIRSVGPKSGYGPKAGEDQIRTPKKKNKEISCLEKF